MFTKIWGDEILMWQTDPEVNCVTDCYSLLAIRRWVSRPSEQ